MSSQNLEIKYNHLLNVNLMTDYRHRSYLNHYNNHIDFLFNLENLYSGNTNNLSNFQFSQYRYTEAENFILNNINISTEQETELDNLEDILYDKIPRKITDYDRNNYELSAIVDNTIRNILLSYRLNFVDAALNPWEETKKIFSNDKYLFKHINDQNEFDIIKKLKYNKNTSEELGSDIYVAIKGNSPKITYGKFKDYIKLRSKMLEIITDLCGVNNDPVLFEKIKKRFDDSEEHGLNETEIKSKIIYPLKRMSKIGSCKEGYFLLLTAEDIHKSYLSHYNRFVGYFNTLEIHKLASIDKSDAENFNFNLHREFFNR